MGRFALSETDDWELAHEEQDIRGWVVRDAAGQDIGRVEELIANTETELVESVVLDTGEEYPARDLDLGDGIVYLRAPRDVGTKAGPVVRKYEGTRIRPIQGDEIGVPEGYEEYRERFRRHYDETYGGAEATYPTYEPAYRIGYAYGVNPTYRSREYEAVEPEMRRRYEEKYGKGEFEKVKDAARHAFRHARR